MYTGEYEGTGCVQGSTVGKRDTEDTGKRHTSCVGMTDNRVISQAAEREVVLWQEVEVEEQTLGSKWTSEDKSGQSNN